MTPRFELGNEGFADPCLTTWLCHRMEKGATSCSFFICGAGDEDFAAAPPVADEARRNRGSGTIGATNGKRKSYCRDGERRSAREIKWSGRRGSNSLPPPWQGGALPDELRPQWCLRPGSDRRHADFQSAALPAELPRHIRLQSQSDEWRPGRGSNPRPPA